MSSLRKNFWAILIAVIVIVLFIVGFREMIIENDVVSGAFGELMENLPFSNEVSKVVCGILKSKNIINNKPAGSSNFIKEAFSLFVLSFLEPVFMMVMSMIFLHMPLNKTVEERERIMRSPSYRFKEMLIRVICTPGFGALSVIVSNYLYDLFIKKIGGIPGLLATVGTVLAAVLLSTITLRLATTFLAALLWRVVITLFYKNLSVLVTEALCFAFYIEILTKNDGKIIGTLVVLFAWIVLASFIEGILQSRITSLGMRRRNTI